MKCIYSRKTKCLNDPEDKIYRNRVYSVLKEWNMLVQYLKQCV